MGKVTSVMELMMRTAMMSSQDGAFTIRNKENEEGKEEGTTW